MNNSITSALCLLLLVASCAIDEGKIETEKNKAADIIAAYMENPEGGDTRLSLDASNNLLWQEGDKISIVGTSSAEFTLSSGKGTQSATFTGNMSGAGAAPYFAVMPKDDGAKVIDNAVVFSIPQQKGAQKNNIAKSTNPMAGKVSGGSVQFHNLFGLLKLTFTSSSSVTIKKITLHDLGGNMLWGTCTIPIKSDTLDYTDIRLSGGDNTINMVWNTPATFGSTARSYYFAVPPGSLDRGFSVVMYEYDSTRDNGIGRAYTFIQKISNPVTAQRSVIINMDAVAMSEKSEPADPKARGYYKSLFVNAGPKLTNNYTTAKFQWIIDLGMENDYEYFVGDSTDYIIAKQASVITRNSNDDNGVLLYPDGSPRFRVVYCNGGKSSNHARTLYQDGRTRYHDFFHNGGSYVGTCAGGFLARSIFDGENCYDNPDTTKNRGFGIWPGTMTSSGMPKNNTNFPTIYTAQTMTKAFGPFAAGDTIERVRHHGGFYINESSSPNKTIPHEILMRYRYTEQNTSDTTSYTEYNRVNYTIFNMGKTKSRDGEVSMIAYKKDETTGRAILCGSHPEAVKLGKNLQLMTRMITYALEGVGDPKVTAALELGEERNSDRIGDRQYHHFTFTSDSDVDGCKIILASSSSADLYLALRKDDIAWLSDADYVICTSGGNKTLNVKSLPAGKWYVSVYCASKITATAKTGSNNLAYWSYDDPTGVLNGIQYSICIQQTGVKGSSQAHFPSESPVASYSMDD